MTSKAALVCCRAAVHMNIPPVSGIVCTMFVATGGVRLSSRGGDVPGREGSRTLLVLQAGTMICSGCREWGCGQW
jgi:hypothetical protein